MTTNNDYPRGIGDVYAVIQSHAHDPEATLRAAASFLRDIRQQNPAEDYHDGVAAAVTALYADPDAYPTVLLGQMYTEARDGWRDRRRCASVHPLSWVCLLPAHHTTKPFGHEIPMHRGLCPDGESVEWVVTADYPDHYTPAASR